MKKQLKHSWKNEINLCFIERVYIRRLCEQLCNTWRVYECTHFVTECFNKEYNLYHFCYSTYKVYWNSTLYMSTIPKTRISLVHLCCRILVQKFCRLTSLAQQLTYSRRNGVKLILVLGTQNIRSTTFAWHRSPMCPLGCTQIIHIFSVGFPCHILYE